MLKRGLEDWLGNIEEPVPRLTAMEWAKEHLEGIIALVSAALGFAAAFFGLKSQVRSHTKDLQAIKREVPRLSIRMGQVENRQEGFERTLAQHFEDQRDERKQLIQAIEGIGNRVNDKITEGVDRLDAEILRARDRLDGMERLIAKIQGHLGRHDA